MLESLICDRIAIFQVTDHSYNIFTFWFHVAHIIFYPPPKKKGWETSFFLISFKFYVQWKFNYEISIFLWYDVKSIVTFRHYVLRFLFFLAELEFFLLYFQVCVLVLFFSVYICMCVFVYVC